MAASGLFFYLGLIMLAHALYMAYSIREQLQVYHHGNGHVPTVHFAGTSMPVTTMMMPIGLEVLSGLVLSIIGFVQRHRMQKARLTDVTKYLRYDHQLNTGVGFIHFNHRGTVACKKDELKDGQKPMAQKKAD